MEKEMVALFGGVIAGSVGLISAVLSHLNLRIQLKQTLNDSNRNREHQLLLSAFPKVLNSIEKSWVLLHHMQNGNTLTKEQLDEYVSLLVWLPNDLRQYMLNILSSYYDSPDKQKALISEMQSKLIEYAKTLSR